MIKIQTAVRITEEFPQGKSDEYIWMEAQPWPVPKKDDAFILKIECFGDELKNSRLIQFADTEVPLHRLEGNDESEVIYRCWYRHDASYISEQMRMFYPPSIRKFPTDPL